MTAKVPARRVLSIWPDKLRAQLAALEAVAEADDVKAEEGVAGTTAERPWAVTAARRERGS